MKRNLTIMLLVLIGCPDGRFPSREQARAAVLVTAETARVMGETCAKVAMADDDLAIAKKCGKAYDDARLSLIATASGVDAWDRVNNHDSVICAVAHALEALTPALEALEARGVQIAIGRDARTLALALGPCKEL